MTKEKRAAAIQYARENKENNLSALKSILKIPSVSTDPELVKEVNQTAEWIASHLRTLGMQNVQVYPTAKHPVVFGEKCVVEGAPTVLIYGHYDVQPVDPRDLWHTDPFDPVIKGDEIYARGASDMKGQMVACMKAIEALVNSGGLPVNVKWLLEGEEEIGSPNLGEFITAHKDLLGCDFVLNPDSGMSGKEDPTITYALRGLAYFDLHITGPEHDLHSGLFGGVVRNPAVVLAELIAGMHDSQGRVTLPGFYDKVREISAEERKELGRLPVNDQQYLKQTGAPALYGEDGFTVNERTGARPTLDVNGMISGFTGTGSKTVIPAWAHAKISMRLVPDQDPADVHKQLIRYLELHAPKEIRWELTCLAGGPPSITDRNSPWVKEMAKALETVWGKPPFYRREGGSIPVVGLLQQHLGVDSVITGFGLPDDNIHAPNEKLSLSTWYRGIEALIHFFLNLVP